MNVEWKPMATAPADSKIDVFYRNPTLGPRAEGVILGARLAGTVWKGAAGGVPALYAVSWRPSKACCMAA